MAAIREHQKFLSKLRISLVSGKLLGGMAGPTSPAVMRAGHGGFVESVERLKEKLADWRDRLGYGDIHSIGQQIGAMLWRSAFYRTINESRRFLYDAEDGEKLANGTLHQLIDDGYFSLAGTAIRRLVDPGSISGPRGVYSLYGLIRDIRDHSKILSRGAVLEARGLVYDYEPIREQSYRARLHKSDEDLMGRGNSGPDWRLSEYWHQVMDEICGVCPEKRSRLDYPLPERFDRLLEGFREIQSIRDWVDKHIAHAASPESRSTVDPDSQTVTLAKIWRAERAIVRAANFISLKIVEGTGACGVPGPAFDQFENIDLPFVESAALGPMRNAFDQHHSEISACRSWSWDKPLISDEDNWHEGA